MKPQNVIRSIGILFTIIGLVFFVVGLSFAISHNRFRSSADLVTAEIARIERRQYGDNASHTVFLNYEYGGASYRDIPISWYSSSMRVGDPLDVLVSPEQPDTPKSTRDLISIVFRPMGLLFAVLGGGFLLVPAVRKAKARRLVLRGDYVDAEIVWVGLNLFVSVNGRHPYRIRCRWHNPMDGKDYEFQSQNLWQDPAVLIDANKISALRVFFDPDKPKQYFVDVSPFLDSP